MLPLLNERQSRIYLGAEAESLGRSGIIKVHKLSKANRRTISAGVKEISAGVKEIEQIKVYPSIISFDGSSTLYTPQQLEKIVMVS
jgi:hypothetical protein